MAEVWLRTNHRAMLLGMILPAAVALVGLTAAIWLPTATPSWIRGVCWGVAGFGVLISLLVATQLKLPRLAYDEGTLRVQLRAGQPFEVPVEVVECCFLGTGAGQVPGDSQSQVPVRNVVLRLAEKATEYHRRDVKEALGKWDEGYITLHGAWCEPLSLEVVQRLNVRLAAAHREVAHERECSPCEAKSSATEVCG